MHQALFNKYFTLGLIPNMAFPQTDLRDVSQLKRMLTWVAQKSEFGAFEIGYMQNEECLSAVRDVVEQSHMEFCYAAQSALLQNGLNPNAEKESERLQAEQMLLHCVDQAAWLRAKRFVFLAGRYRETQREAAYRQLLKSTINVCRYAQSRGIFVEIEQFDFDIAKRALLGPAELTARFAADVRTVCSNFGILVDLSHIPMLHDSVSHVVGSLRAYITHFHIGNTVCGSPDDEGYGDEHQRFGFPNSANDTDEVYEFLRVLRQEGFFRAADPFLLSFEVKPWKEEDGTLIVANALRVLNRAWALIED